MFADVLNGFLADILGRNIFDVAEPNVRIESLRLGLLAKLINAGRTCVVGSKCEQQLVRAVHLRILEVLVNHESKVLHSGVDVIVSISLDIPYAHGWVGSSTRFDLHHADGFGVRCDFLAPTVGQSVALDIRRSTVRGCPQIYLQRTILRRPLR